MTSALRLEACQREVSQGQFQSFMVTTRNLRVKTYVTLQVRKILYVLKTEPKRWLC